VAEEKDVELAPGKSGISMKTIIIITIVVIVLIAGSIGLTVFLLLDNTEKSNSIVSEQIEGDEIEAINKPAIYFLLKPDFVINFESDGKANFLSVQIEVMAREEEPIKVIQDNMPVLRNNVLLLLSAQKYDVVRTLEGKNKLRKDIQNIIKKIIDEENENLKKNDGEDFHKIADVEAIYFTGFIMQ